MDLQTLRFFVAVADEGSLSAAAESLHYAQSNLSTRLKQLEDELGEPLFYRLRRGVSLTAKGRLFYDYSMRVLRLSEEAVTAIRDMEHPRGKLMLGSLEATALKDLPELLAAYHSRCPEVQLSLETDMNDVFEPRVLSRRLDGAFVAGPVEHPALEELSFRREKLILVGGAGQAGESAAAILSEAPLISFPEGSVFRRRLELLLASRALAFRDRLTVLNSLGAMIAGICAGIGFGYLPRSVVASYLARGLMVEYPLEDPYSVLQVVFLYRKDRLRDAAFRSFLELLQNGQTEL